MRGACLNLSLFNNLRARPKMARRLASVRGERGGGSGFCRVAESQRTKAEAAAKESIKVGTLLRDAIDTFSYDGIVEI